MATTLEKYYHYVGVKKEVANNLNAKTKELKELQQRQINIEDTQALLQQVAQETQSTFKVHLEDIVQSGLDTVFGGEYTFHINFVPSRGRTVCDMYLTDNSGFRINPIDGNGGGVVDIMSLTLRLATWSLTKPDNCLLLDEPFKWLSASLRPLAGEIVTTMSKKLGIQIIMVTHDETMIEIADKIFRVTKNKRDISRVRVIKGGS